ncbi:helix-turn-helix domain-containing protein [Pedobacter insulae]|uniref:Helix-turn-helix domain-containing protein n=1 Tax=Pedobacter insulae TaxID=414048 RepID=A0A1I2ULG1_9SPHI|nr:helix-turn-helix transcriptional regulator [Pedobacter insulae]SFG78002.1 Helix-turn-helix domain-containing protein [Pedobacter insulae]
MSLIGKNIRTLRQKNGWSQGEVAKRLAISIPAFSKIETGITDVNISRLDQIATLFEVSTIDLISKEGEHHQSENAAEISMLREKIAFKEEEIISLQKKVIELYEELRNKDKAAG